MGKPYSLDLRDRICAYVAGAIQRVLRGGCGEALRPPCGSQLSKRQKVSVLRCHKGDRLDGLAKSRYLIIALPL